MILLRARLTIHEHYRTAFLHHFAELITASQAEDGCLRFEAGENIGKPNCFLVLGAWDTVSALQQHEASAHVAHFKQRSSGMIAERDPSYIYHVEKTELL